MYYSPSTGGFYSVEIHGDSIPQDAVAISPDEHAALMSAQASGKIIERDAEGRPVAVARPPLPLLTVKSRAAATVDESAEVARLRYVTPGSAQAMVYQNKASEARALRVVVEGGGTPNADDYPHLAAEVGITADSLVAVADVVLAKAAEWVRASASIEGRRLAAKKAIAAAPDAAAVQAVLDSLTWPTLEASTPS